jgi:pseudouridine synthase
MRLQSFLSRSGIASRRRAADLVREGKVTVNGEVVREPGRAVDPARDAVAFEGRAVRPQEKLYFAFHKPRGVITTLKDTHGRRTVADFFRSVAARVYPVGRLDRDTSGLLLVTNDGDFALKIGHPRYGFEKVYEAVLAAPLGAGALARAERGLRVEGRLTRPCRIEPRGRVGKGFLYVVRLHEGRKRQIRLMMLEVGARLVGLHRTRVGPIALGDLKPGAFRPLGAEELALLNRHACRGAGAESGGGKSGFELRVGRFARKQRRGEAPRRRGRRHAVPAEARGPEKIP